MDELIRSCGKQLTGTFLQFDANHLIGNDYSIQTRYDVSSFLSQRAITSVSDPEWMLEINQLLYSIQRRDKSALQRLVQSAAPKLLGIIHRILNNQQEAEDCLQEVLIKVWQQASQFSGTGSAWGWLCVLARNTALDRLRSLSTRSYLSLDANDDDSGHLLQSLFESHGAEPQALNRHALNNCLSKLKPQPRQSILLSFVYGYSHAELVERLQSPAGTIKAWIRRGLQELKTCLAA